MNSLHKHFNCQLQLIWDDLRLAKEKYSPLFLSQDEDSTVRQLLLGKQSEVIEKIESVTAPIDWNNLASWIQNADEYFQRQQRHYSGYVTLLGYDASKTNWFDIIAHDPINMIQASAAGQQLRRSFGPNWMAALDALQYLSPVPSPNNSVVPERFKAFVLMRTQKIAENRDKLRKDVRGRASFRRKWRQLTRMARKQWLLQMRCISTHPHFHIYAWSQRRESGDKSIKRPFFMSALLNIEDLSHGNVLPDFLDARANIHPRQFRRTDSLSVYSGVYTGYLSLKCVPGMVLRFAPEASGTDEYQISLEPNLIVDGASVPTSQNEETPGMGLLQLEAQECIYGFLADCLSVGLNHLVPGSENTLSPQNTDHEECPSLLTRAVRLDYYGRPGTIDLKYLGNLVNASLDEAREDLWQLRQDSQVWVNRLEKTPGAMFGRTWNLLRVVFGRIDSFYTLSRHLLVLNKCEFFAQQNHNLDTSGLSKDDEALGLLISLHVACLSVLEEHLCQLKNMSWSDGAAKKNPVLFQLLESLRTNDPALRVLGLPEVMRVVDREIEKVDFKESTTFTTLQALNDVSVIAGCLKESAKHYDLVGEHLHLANELENKWEHQDRPWRSVVEGTLASLGETECHKLDGHIRNQNIDAQSRHVDFWHVIDRHMAASSRGNRAAERVVHKIQQAAPIDIMRRSHTQADWLGKLDGEPGVTMTKLRRSKRRPHIQHEMLVLPPEQITKQRPLPTIKPTRDMWFWKTISAPSSENSSELSWSDFERAMVGIGYQLHRHGGSGRRFEYGKGEASSCASHGTPGIIVFHEPHAKQAKVPHHLARSWWLRRLQRRFKLEL